MARHTNSGGDSGLSNSGTISSDFTETTKVWVSLHQLINLEATVNLTKKSSEVDASRVSLWFKGLDLGEKDWGIYGVKRASRGRGGAMRNSNGG